MLSDKARDALIGIRMNIDAARAFTEGMNFDTFTRDLKTFYAVTRALEIISEASRRLPDDLKERYPGVAWRAIHASGNIYRHKYDSVDALLVWQTIHDHLQSLAKVIDLELSGKK